MGLGLLAGAGAVVDYWPVGGAMPGVRQAVLPMPDVPVLAQNLDMAIPEPAAVPRRAPALRLTAAGARLFLPPAEPVAPLPRVVAPEPLPVPAWESIPVDAATPELLSVSLVDAGLVIAAPTVDDDSGDPGLIGGAIRKTKDSLMRTGAVTRASLADAVRGVVGAFRKVTPF
jgi:hypothetical protein